MASPQTAPTRRPPPPTAPPHAAAPPPGYFTPFTGPPPRYAAVVSKVYPYSLRPVLIFTSFLGFLWAIVMGVNSIRNRSNSGGGCSARRRLYVRGTDHCAETSNQKMFDLVNAILYFVVAGIEVFGMVVGIMVRRRDLMKGIDVAVLTSP